MPLTHEPFERFAGDTWKFQADLNDDSGEDLDLTEALMSNGSCMTRHLVWWCVTLTLGDGLTVSGDPTEGKVLIIVSPEQSALAPGTYYDIIRVTLASGIVTTQAWG